MKTKEGVEYSKSGTKYGILSGKFLQSSICINLHYYLFIFMRFFFCFLKELKRNSLKICPRWFGKRKMKVNVFVLKRHLLLRIVCVDVVYRILGFPIISVNTADAHRHWNIAFFT